MAKKLWPYQNTIKPKTLEKYYKSKDGKGAWERAEYYYDLWVQVTALIDPPPRWKDLDIRTKLGLCAVAEGLIMEHTGEGVHLVGVISRI